MPFTFTLQRSVQPLGIGGTWMINEHGITPATDEGFRLAAYTEQVEGERRRKRPTAKQ